MDKRQTAVGFLKAFTLIGGVLAVFTAPAAAPKGSTNPPARLNLQEAPLSREVKLATSLAPIAKRVASSVVNIYSTTIVKEHPAIPHQFFDDPMFRRFFGEGFGGSRGGGGRPRERRAQGLGSGVVVSPEGYILTANHVIEGADEVKVALADDDQEFDAKVIGTDPQTDIAVLRVEIKKPLPAVAISDSDKLEVGDMVVAVGNPFGIGQTVTMGIVSAVGRGGFGITGYENFIQTDAAINEGNSGGALVDAEGRLVGINTAIISRSGGFQGVGLAVPINMARFVMDRLIAEGRVARGYLGINIQPLTRDLAQAFGLNDESSGVLVGGVSSGSAAAKAGIKEGDVITEVNGKKVSDPRNLQLIVSQNSPGTKVNVRILRGGESGKATERVVAATLAELPRELAAGSSGEGMSPESSNKDALEGVEVTDLDSTVRRQFSVPENIRGALVTSVEPGSNSAEAGLRPGDVILEMDRKPVRSAEDAVRLSDAASGDKIVLRVWSTGRGGAAGTRYLVVDNSTK